MSATTLLTFLFALATGLVSLALVSRRSQHHYSPVTEALITPLLFYNLWILVRLTFRVVESSVLGGLPPTLGRLLITGLLWLSMAAVIHLGSSYLVFTLLASQPGRPQTFLRLAPKGAALFAGGLALICLGLFVLRQDALMRVFARGLVSIVFLGVAGLSLWFFLRAHRAQKEASWRNLRILGAAYSLIFVALTGFIWWYRFSATIPQATYVNVTVGFEILYNLMTVAWIHLFDRTAPVPVKTEVQTPRPPAIPDMDAFGISGREAEVIHLVCQGLTNQEIADRLFISLKTVKDHNYRIFQKTGVRNRVELAQLVRQSPMNGGEVPG